MKSILFERRNSPYGWLTSEACDWLEKQKVIKWNPELSTWAFLSIPVILTRKEEGKKKEVVIRRNDCYNDGLLEWVIKNKTGESHPDKAKTIEEFMKAGYDFKKHANKYNETFGISFSVESVVLN